MKDGQKVKALRSSFSNKLNYYEEISKYIEDKNNTTLNLINGSYLETPKSEQKRNDSIKQLLTRQGLREDSTEKDSKYDKNKNEVKKDNKAENSTTNKQNNSSTTNKNNTKQ